MIISARMPRASLRPLRHGLSAVLTWLRHRSRAARRRRQTLNPMHMSDYLRQDMGLQDYHLTNRRQ